MFRLNFDKWAVVFAVIVFAAFLSGGCTVNVNQPNTANNANTGATSSPQKSTASSPVATPEPRRTSLFDEEFSLKPGAIRDVRFTIPNEEKAARLNGGLRVQNNNRIDVYVYPAADYSESPDKSRKSIHLVQIKNEKIDERLERGDYVLVFENNSPIETVTVAAEFFLVFD